MPRLFRVILALLLALSSSHVTSAQATFPTKFSPEIAARADVKQALAFIDQILFLGPHALGIKGSLGGMTLDVSTQFFGPLRAGAPIDAVVDVLRETGRLMFLRGLLEQDGQAAVAFSGTIRKARA